MSEQYLKKACDAENLKNFHFFEHIHKQTFIFHVKTD